MTPAQRLVEALHDAGIVGAAAGVVTGDPTKGEHGWSVRLVLLAHDTERLIDLLNERRDL